MTNGIFITATGTGAGKTFVTRALARAFVTRGHRVAALKPVETGCLGVASAEPHTRERLAADAHALVAADAVALARAARRPELATAAGFHRARAPVSPRAAELAGEGRVPSVEDLVAAILDASAGSDVALVEGAGGICVPLGARTTFADLAAALRWPIAIVAPDQLGVLSHVITAVESAERRGLRVAAIVLDQWPPADESRAHNGVILTETLGLPVRAFPATRDDDDALARAAEAAGLPDLILAAPTSARAGR